MGMPSPVPRLQRGPWVIPQSSFHCQMYCEFPKTSKSTCTTITFHSNIPPLLSSRFFISSFYLPRMMLLQGGVLAELPACVGASSTPTSPGVSPDPPECDAHRRERGASLHRASIPPPPPGSLQVQRSCGGLPARPPHSHSPPAQDSLHCAPHPHSRSRPQPQRWTRARDDEGLGRGGSAHRAPRAGRPCS